MFGNFKVSRDLKKTKEYIGNTNNIGVYMQNIDNLEELETVVNNLDDLIKVDKLILGCELELSLLGEIYKDTKAKYYLNKFGVLSLKLDGSNNTIKKFSTVVETYKGIKIKLVNIKDLDVVQEVLEICKEYNIGVLYQDSLDKEDLEDILVIKEDVEQTNIQGLLNTNNVLSLIKTTVNIWNYYVNYKLKDKNIHDYIIAEGSKEGNTLEKVKYAIYSELLELGTIYDISYNKIYKFTGIDYQVVYQYARKMRSEGIDLYDKYIDKDKNTKAKLIEKNKEKYKLFNRAIKDLIDHPSKTIKYVCSEYGINTNILSTYITRELYVVDESLYKLYKNRK